MTLRLKSGYLPDLGRQDTTHVERWAYHEDYCITLYLICMQGNIASIDLATTHGKKKSRVKTPCNP